MRSPCVNCIRVDENKDDCLKTCEKLKQYQQAACSRRSLDWEATSLENSTSV